MGWDIPEERGKAAVVRSCHSLSVMAAQASLPPPVQGQLMETLRQMAASQI